MDRFYAMQVFVAVAETESFTKAGRILAISPPAVTRTISALEERLGVRLLTRTTRVVRLTEAGTRYLDDSRRIMMALDEADESAAGINATPRGQLHLTAPILFGKMFVTSIVLEYLDRYPEVDVNALFVDRIVNLVEEGMDVAIRIGELPDSSLRAIQVGKVRQIVVASPRYLEQHGALQHPRDLKSHRIVTAMGITALPEWKFYADGKSIAARIAARMTVTTIESAIEAVRAAWGITRLLSYQADPYLKTGEITTVLNAFEPPALPIYVVHPGGPRPSAKVRTFVDLAVERLRARV